MVPCVSQEVGFHLERNGRHVSKKMCKRHVSQYRAGGGFGSCEIPNGEMLHSKIVPHFAVVFKDQSHVLAFTRSMPLFSPLQGSEGLNCWGHHVFTFDPVSQESCRESR